MQRRQPRLGPIAVLRLRVAEILAVLLEDVAEAARQRPDVRGDAEAQAVDRTHRIGQTRNVMVYRLVAKDTVEEKVMALKARKARLFSSVLDDGNVFGAALDADDIRALFS